VVRVTLDDDSDDLPTVFFPYCGDSEMLKPPFLKTCIESRFSPLVADEKMDESIFQSLHQLKISRDTVVVAITESCVPQVSEEKDFSEENKRPVLFFVQKTQVSEIGFLCIKLF
jgi:hypothetical protein